MGGAVSFWRNPMTRLEEINHAAARMRAGAALHLSYQSTPYWALSTGERITTAVARVLIATPGVVAVGDALFDGVPSQTYRWAEPTCCGF
jgi:hypothetical protein